MSISIQPRNPGAKQTLVSAVQGQKSNSPVNMTTGAPAPSEPAPRQENTVEATPAAAEVTPAEGKKDDFLSPRFAALARKEKQIQAERERLKAEKVALEQEKQARLNGYIPKDKFKQNPLAAIEEAGVSYDELTQQLINAPQAQIDPTVRQLQSELAELKGILSDFRTKQEESQSTAYKQALDTIRHKASSILSSDPQFEVIKFLNSADEEETPGLAEVVSYIEKEFKENGIVPSELEAMQFIENRHTENFLRFLEVPKLRKLALEKLAPPTAPEPTEPAQEKQLNTQQPQIKTLTNAVNSTAPRRLTERERIERAKLAAMGKLQN